MLLCPEFVRLQSMLSNKALVDNYLRSKLLRFLQYPKYNYWKHLSHKIPLLKGKQPLLRWFYNEVI